MKQTCVVLCLIALFSCPVFAQDSRVTAYQSDGITFYHTSDGTGMSVKTGSLTTHRLPNGTHGYTIENDGYTFSNFNDGSRITTIKNGDLTIHNVDGNPWGFFNVDGNSD